MRVPPPVECTNTVAQFTNEVHSSVCLSTKQENGRICLTVPSQMEGKMDSTTGDSFIFVKYFFHISEIFLGEKVNHPQFSLSGQFPHSCLFQKKIFHIFYTSCFLQGNSREKNHACK